MFVYLHSDNAIPAPDPSKNLLVWQEHRLPDGALYWSRQISLPSSSQDRPIAFVVTDLDLREADILSRVDYFLATSMPYIEKDLQRAQDAKGFKVTLEGDENSEVWITLSSNAASGTTRPSIQSLPGVGSNDLKILWVDHAERIMRESNEDKERPGAFQDEVIYRALIDGFICEIYRAHLKTNIGMALEFSYWSFVEAHPAHRSSSRRDQDEALEFLAWCFTGKCTRVCFYYI